MKTRIIFNYLVLLILLMGINSCGIHSKKENFKIEKAPILGAWEMSSIYWITKDTTYSIEIAQPGMIMFTPSRYSIMWTPIEESRTPFENLSKPTDEELKAGFKSIVFNSGTYIYSDSTITTTAKIAKVPGFEGGKQLYRYKIKNNKMELTMFDEVYPDGTKPSWSGKYQTKFVFKKVE